MNKNSEPEPAVETDYTREIAANFRRLEFDVGEHCSRRTTFRDR